MSRERQSLWLAIHDVQAELRKELEDAARLARARRVVVAGDEDDRRFGQRRDEPAELEEGVDDRLIGGADVVKDVARYHHQLRPQLDDPVDSHAERGGHVGFALVDPGWRQPLILPVTEVKIGEVNQAHAAGSVQGI